MDASTWCALVLAAELRVASSGPGFGLSIEVEPPDPAETTPVTLVLLDGCACMFDTVCDVAGRWKTPADLQVDWYITPWPGICPTVCVPLASELDLGRLEPGTYHVAVTQYFGGCIAGEPWAWRTAETNFRVYSACDFDRNGAIDGSDYSAFFTCLAGPAGQSSIPACSQTDVDGDRDTDLRDFAAFQAAFTGQ